MEWAQRLASSRVVYLVSSPGWHGSVALDDTSATALMGGVEVGSIYSTILGRIEYVYVRLDLGLSFAVDDRLALYHQETSASHCHALLGFDDHATPVPRNLGTLMAGNAVASRYLIKYALKAGPSWFQIQTLPHRIAVHEDRFLTLTLADRIALRENLRRSIHVDEYCMLSRSDIYVLVTRLRLIEAAIIVSM